MKTNYQAEEIINFWFEELTSDQFFNGGVAVDNMITERYEDLYNSVLAGEKYEWRKTPHGRLAEIIVLDQFARNMYRNTRDAYQGDAMALCLAQQAIATGDDLKIPENQRMFLYLPFMHSESAKIHEVSMELFASLGSTEYEIKHKVIIDQFGRYPYMNDALERESTPEEIEWLKTNNGF